MSPTVLVLGVVAFCVSLLAHVVLWRVRRPRRDVVGLALVFVVLPALVLGLAVTSGWVEPSECLAASALLHLSLASAYIQTYPAVQAVSPTLKLIQILDRNAARGATEDELRHALDTRSGLSDRFEDLRHNSFVQVREGRYELAVSGRMIVRFFQRYRALLGLGASRG